jgi:hypothetical protein
MNDTNTNTNTNTVTKTFVKEEDRMQFLPDYFTIQHTPPMEEAIFRAADLYWKDYSGGYWEFYHITDLKGDKAPLIEIGQTDDIRVVIESNYTDLTTSPLAASTALNLITFNHASWHYAHKGNNIEFAKKLDGYYFSLRDWFFETDELTKTEVQDIIIMID